MAKLNDLIGKTFGNWQVLYRNGSTPNKASIWRCRCLLCGHERDVVGYSLTSGASTKCRSCVPKLTLAKPHRDESIYKIWCGMKQRCYNQNHVSYAAYGGRGIHICEEWLDNFDSFFEWAFSSGYTNGLTIDRIDVNGNYCPENCRWVLSYSQAANRRNNLYINYNNSVVCLSEACRLANINYDAVRSRIRNKKVTPQEAFDYYR